MPTIRVAIDSRASIRGAALHASATNQMKSANRALVSSQKSVDTATKNTAQSVKVLSSSMLQVEASFNLALRAIRTFERAIEPLIRFEETIATVAGVTQATTFEIERLTDAARTMGATTRFSATEAGQGLLFLSRAGFEVDEAITALPATLNLAQAGALGLGSAADIASNVLSQFRLEADQTNVVVDTLIATSNRANTDVRQLSEALKFAGPVAGALGKSVEETAAALGVLGDSGIQASLAGTNFRGVMSALLGPTSEARAAIAGLGFTVQDLDPSINPIIDIFDRLRQAQLTAAEATAIFGRRNQSAALTLTASVQKIRELEQANKNAAGEADRLAKLMDDTLSGSLKSLQSAAEALVLSLGDQGLNEGLRTIIDTATSTIRALAGMDDAVERNREVAQLLAAAIKGLTVGVATLITLRVAAFFYSAAQAAFTLATSVGALNAALAANPFGAAAVSISLLVGALVAAEDAFGNNTEAARRNAETLGLMSKAADSLAAAQKRVIEAEKLGDRQKQISALKERISATQSLINNQTELAQQIRTNDVLVRGSIPGAFVRGEISGSDSEVQRSRKAIEDAELRARERFNRRGFTGSLRRFIDESQLEATDLGGPITPRFETTPQPGSFTAFTVKPVLDQEKVLERLFLQREKLRSQLSLLEHAEKTETEERRRSEQAAKDQITLLKRLENTRHGLQAQLNAANQEEVVAATRRDQFIRQANEIANQQKLSAKAREDLIGTVRSQLQEIEKLELATKRQAEAEKQAEAALKARQRAQTEARKTLIEMESTLREQQKLLQAELLGNKVSAEFIKARAAANILGANATDDERHAFGHWVLEIERLAAANQDARKEIERREQAHRDAAAARRGLDAFEKQLRQEIELLRLGNSERAIQVGLLRARAIAERGGIALDGDREARIVEQLRERQKLQEQIDRTNQGGRRPRRFGIDPTLAQNFAAFNSGADSLDTLTESFAGSAFNAREFNALLRASSTATTVLQDDLARLEERMAITGEDMSQQIQLVEVRIGELATNAIAQAIAAVGDLRQQLADDTFFVSLGRLQEGIVRLGSVRSVVDGIGTALEGSFGRAFDSIIDGTFRVQDAFKDLARSIIEETAKQAVVKPLAGALSGAIGLGLGALTGGAGLVGGGLFGPLLTGLFGGAARGRVLIGGGYSAYARGGVLGGPMTFPLSDGRTGLAGEAGPEGILPLTRDRFGRLGVTSVGEGGGSRQVNKTFNFNISARDVDSFRRSTTQLRDQMLKDNGF